MTPLKALALVCTLSPSPAPSSSTLLAQQVLAALEEKGAHTDLVRVVDYDVHPGVQLDMQRGDQWPLIRQKVMEADILVLSTPTWMGQHSSVAQRVLERLDAELSETDEEGRYQTYPKVALAAIVGNEDGAHHISAIFYQCLNDVGFTIPANAVVYWNDASMSDEPRDYKDLEQTPQKVLSTIEVMTTNAAHLAQLLREAKYPPAG